MVPKLEQVFFQGFPQELNFNILKHLYKHIIGEEIVW